MSSPADDTRERVEKWLNKSGFRLEFKVAEAFRKARFDVAQHHFIDDPISSKRRELDVVADVQRRIPVAPPLNVGESEVWVSVTTVVECKRHAEPWVLFGGPTDPAMTEKRGPDEAEIGDRISAMTATMGSSLGLAAIWHMAGNGVGLDLPLTIPGQYLAHGGTTFEKDKSNDKDEFYNAVQQVVSGASALIQEQFDHSFWLCPSQATIVLPVVEQAIRGSSEQAICGTCHESNVGVGVDLAAA